MTIWAITGFQDDEAPHWSVAYIEAPNEDSAKETLNVLLHDATRCPETVWKSNLTPPERWQTTKAVRPFTFILGGGCR